MTGLDIALAHAARGRLVFPYVRQPTPDGHWKKMPLVRWKSEATSDPEAIAELWRGRSRRPAGWVFPEGLVVVDIDDPAAFDAAGYDLPPTASQSTQRGAHHLYQVADAREIPQGTNVVPGADTRVGGKGWVALYAADAFGGSIAPAPDWLYALERPKGHATDEPISSRLEILSLAGRLRWAGLDGDEINDVLTHRLADGRIHSAREEDPWTEADLARIASDYGAKPMGREDEVLITPPWPRAAGASSASGGRRRAGFRRAGIRDVR